MKDNIHRALVVFIVWIAGVDLGVCLGNEAAEGPSLPQIWMGAAVLSVAALIAVVGRFVITASRK